MMIMAKWLLPAIILYCLHHLFVQAPLVPNPFKSRFGGASQRIEKLGTSRPVAPSAGPSSRNANWDSRRADNQFRRKCEKFRRNLRRADLWIDNGEELITLVIRRDKIFEDSFKKTIGFRLTRWEKPWWISFTGEPGTGTGVQREWYTALIRSTVDRNVQLFIASDGDRDAYTINPNKEATSKTLKHFSFIGRVIAKAVYDGQQLPMYFTRSMYKHILGKQVDCTDLAIEDPEYYRSLQFIRENDVGQIQEALGQSLKWSVEVTEGGKKVERELKPGGRRINVTNGQREDYVNSVCKTKLHTVIKKQLDAFLNGFYDIIPKASVSIFDERELELVISGPPVINVDDWKNNTLYVGYTADWPTIEWFWAGLRAFTQEQLGRFLHYVTGSSKPPLRGFAHLDGNVEGVRKFTIRHGNVLKASVCHYELILPSYFESEEDLKQILITIVESFTHGFNRD